MLGDYSKLTFDEEMAKRGGGLFWMFPKAMGSVPVGVPEMR